MPKPTMIGIRLKAIRTRKGMSQNQLSIAAGVPRSTIGQVESGLQQSMSIENLIKIARALRVTLDQLVQPDVLEESEDDPPQTAARAGGLGGSDAGAQTKELTAVGS